MTEMKGNFYSNFTSNLGFAILAFYENKAVTIFIGNKNIKHIMTQKGRSRVLPAGGG